MTQTWIAAFRSAPVSPYEPTLVYPSRSFNNQTLRQIVRVRGGGDHLRVRFSNLYGKEPLTIARTRVALHATGSAIAPGTDIEVTFGHTSDVTIDAGHEAVSDPVGLATTTETDLVISTYYATPCGPATYHPFALRTGYVAAGDATSQPGLLHPEEVEPRFHLTGVDVLTSPGRRVVAAFGDSLSDGVGSTPGANLRYTDQLAHRTAAADMSVINLGIAGNRLLTDVFGESGTARFDRDVLAAPGVTHLILELGLNDICLPGMLGTPQVSADELIDGYTTIAERARRHGLTTIITTLTPFSGAEAISSGFDNPENEELRQRINRWIRTSREFDAVADLDRALRHPAAPATLYPDYDSGDHIHPNDAGAQAMADTIAKALQV
ncbi:SGNH/GDSL hydrolase family protein [Nonomuraea jabiensis]|uniref:Lysophospholipase L1-like esterase n=1 Tax=Nonomuraea jabiensis TaxID=882448 RepID=A0A7W9LGY0_9ACTN|nr:SGNH/GDSL hydrolase family protein [Nonomuraea jabiensis]MBB5783431.1 lysophospholipase L1-like esterase [Nonomuraea jabiensis]